MYCNALLFIGRHNNLQDKYTVYLHKVSNYILLKDGSEKDITQKTGRDLHRESEAESVFSFQMNQFILINVLIWGLSYDSD